MNTVYIGEDNFIRNLDTPHKGIIDFLLSSNTHCTIIKDEPTSLVNQGIKFLYIYPLLDLAYFNNKKIPSPPQEIINFIKAGKCKLVFIYPQEGNLFEKDRLNLLVEFIKNRNLSAKNTFLFNSNFALQQQFERFGFDSKLLTIEKLNYFEFNPWFIDFFPKSETQKDQLKKEYINKFRVNKNKFKQFYFNSLNRLPRAHRIFLFTLMHENLNIRNKSLMSLGPLSLWSNVKKAPDYFKHIFDKQGLLSKYENFLSSRGKEWVKNGIQVDGSLIPNQASNFNLDIYNNSHISIITETEVEDGILFFSEKIFKPIVAGHPFILLGGKGSLKKLKELGYKTFDRWWDESYDDKESWQERATEVFKLVSNLSSLSPKSLELIVNDMSETLEHNIELFFQDKRGKLFYSRLYEIQDYVKKNKNLI